MPPATASYRLSRGGLLAALLLLLLAGGPGCSNVQSLRHGRDQLAAGNNSQALDSLNKALLGGRLYPHEVLEARRWRATALVRLGRFDEALADLDPVVLETPGDIRARHLRGLALRALGNTGAAAREFEAVITLQQAAAARVRLGGGPSARRSLHARMQARSLPYTTHLAASSQMALGEIALCDNRFEDALRHFDLAVTLQPFEPEPYYTRAAALQYLEQGEEAARDLQAYRQLGGNQTRNLADVSGPLQLKQALAFFDSKRHADAEAAATAALERNPRHAAAALIRGLARARQGRHAQAVEDFSLVLAVEPDNEQALLYRAFSLTELNQCQAALQDAERALSRNPAALHAQLQRGYALLGLRNYEEAEQAFSRVLENTPDQPAALFHRSICRLKLLQPDAAVTDLQALLDADPDDSRTLFFLGLACQRAGDYDRSLEALRRATALVPDGDYAADAWYAAGMAQAALNRSEDSADSLRRAIALEQGHRAAHLALALVLARLGQHDEAEAMYVKARQLSPAPDAATSPQAQQAQLLPEYSEAELKQALAAAAPVQEQDLAAVSNATATDPPAPESKAKSKRKKRRHRQ